MTTASRDAYMERRNNAELFRESERGKYAVAMAPSFFIEHHRKVWQKRNIGADTIHDIEYMLANIYMPFLRGGVQWYEPEEVESVGVQSLKSV